MKPRIVVDLVINSETLHPEKITELIGLAPTQVYLKGELIEWTIRKRTVNSWCYSLRDNVDDYDLGEFLAKLVEELAPKAEQIRTIVKNYEVEAIFSCGIEVVDEKPAIYLGPELISEMSRMGASLDIDIILME